MRYFVPIFFICAILSTPTFACECNSEGSFLTNSPGSSFIALVKVKRFSTFKDVYFEQSPTRIPISMEVELIDIYKGRENRKTFTVWGSPGHLCRQYLSVFREEHFYVIAFLPAFETESDYTLSSCGTNFLSVDFDSLLVTGDIGLNDQNSQTVSLIELKAAISNQKKTIYKFAQSALIDGCGNLLLQKKSVDNIYELRVSIQMDSISQRVYQIGDQRKLVKIVLREYPDDNHFIQRICDDSGIEQYDKEPDVYEAVTGTIIINTSVKDKRGKFRVSVSLMKVELRNKAHNIIQLPTERFENVGVGWFGG